MTGDFSSWQEKDGIKVRYNLKNAGWFSWYRMQDLDNVRKGKATYIGDDYALVK